MTQFKPQPNAWWLAATEAEITQEIRRGLENLPGVHTTADTVEHLFPVAGARGAGLDRRQHLFTRLMKGADKHFRDCHTRGEPVKGTFGLKRPYLWHKPKPPCWNCGGTGFAA